jgi:hypothetical protein
MSDHIDTPEVARALRDLRMRYRERIWETSARIAQRRGTTSPRSDVAILKRLHEADVSSPDRHGTEMKRCDRSGVAPRQAATATTGARSNDGRSGMHEAHLRRAYLLISRGRARPREVHGRAAQYSPADTRVVAIRSAVASYPACDRCCPSGSQKLWVFAGSMKPTQ